jgi:tRNA-binding EMAP/Myf-like protein
MKRSCVECDDVCIEDDSDCCLSCGGDLKISTSSSDLVSSPFVVGLIVTCEPVVGKDKLKVVTVNIGNNKIITVVTSAPNVAEKLRVVVAVEGASLKDGTLVKPTNVGGIKSYGILCDNNMLNWSGGGAGNAALVPDTCEIGSSPPETRPRLKYSCLFE